jgi:hypothetical protein
MTEPPETESRLQSLATDEFFYFFLRLRKGEVRRTVANLRTRYPDEAPEQLAARLVAAKSRLSLLGGALLAVPLLFPGVGQALKLAGAVGATSLLTRMHLYLILEIALVFGKNIDDSARVPEMIAVVAATGLGAASPMLAQNQGLDPRFTPAVGALSCAAVSQVVGRAAIALYRPKPILEEAEGASEGAMPA